MDKASKALRRSSIRLKSISSGHQDLNLVLSELRDVKSTAKAFMAAQATASQDLLRWSHTSELKAMQDTFLQFAELNNLWTEAQREFIEKFKAFIRQFEMILEGDQHVDKVRSNVTACERREMRIRKDLKSAANKSAAEEVCQLEIKLAQAERTKDLAKLEVLDCIKENEAVKIIRVKEGMLKLSDSYMELSNKCQIIHKANKDVASLLPDVQDKNIHEIQYAGPAAADSIVTAAKECVRQQGHEQYAVSPSAPHPDDLPPPYSPTVGSLAYRTPPSHNYLSPPHSSTNPFDTRRHSTPHSLSRRSAGDQHRLRHHPETYQGRD